METLTFGQVMQWLTDGGAVAALLLFGFLFWSGQIVSKRSVDQLVEVHKTAAEKLASTYQEQVKIMSNGFLGKLEETTDQQSKAVGDLVVVMRESISDARASREKMQEVVSALNEKLTRIDAKQNGVTVPRRRRKS